MNLPTLVMHALEFNGAVVNFIDTYLNISTTTQAKLFILYDRRVVLNEFGNDLPVDHGTWLPFSTKAMSIVTNCDHLIIDKQVMIDMILNNTRPAARRTTLLYPSLICEKLGSSAVTLDQIDDFLMTNNVTVVGNVFNRQLLSPSITYVDWLLRFSEQRITALYKREPTRTAFTTNDYTRLKSLDTSVNAFDFAEYNYARREVCPGIFYENIGRLVFEFALLGRQVYYNPANKMYDDGLTEYLRLLNVDDSASGYLQLNADKLVGPDDVVKKLLSR